MPVPVPVPVVVPVRVPGPDHERGHAVHDEPEHGDRERVEVVDRLGVQELLDALDPEQQRDDREHDAAGEAGERVDLAGAEAERIVARVLARVPVRDEREPERADVRAHVPAVRLERLRARDRPDDDLADHHHERDQDHRERAPLSGPVERTLVLVVRVRGEIVRAGCARRLRRHAEPAV